MEGFLIRNNSWTLIGSQLSMGKKKVCLVILNTVHKWREEKIVLFFIMTKTEPLIRKMLMTSEIHFTTIDQIILFSTKNLETISSLGYKCKMKSSNQQNS